MAELSSIAAAVKRRSGRIPSYRVREGARPTLPRAERRQVDPPNKLYDIEVVEEADEKVKIHYLGYSDKYDEWIQRRDVVYRPPSREADCEEETLSPLRLLTCAIKQKLWPSKVEDPEVKVYIPFTTEAFQKLAANAELVGVVRGQERYTIDRYSALTDVLGEQWFIRIVNIHGDFAYTILETIYFHLFRPKPMLDYAVDVTEEGSTKFTPAYIEHSLSLCFHFVRGDGNRHKLKDFL